MAAMPWEFMLPTDEMRAPKRITISTSQRMPIATRSGRSKQAKRGLMQRLVFDVSKGDIVTPPRGYDQT